MKAAGDAEEPNMAAHHIVPETDRNTAKAREILEKHDIDINSAENGVFLPNRKNSDESMSGILHNGRHPASYVNNVENRLVYADKVGGK